MGGNWQSWRWASRLPPAALAQNGARPAPGALTGAKGAAGATERVACFLSSRRWDFTLQTLNPVWCFTTAPKAGKFLTDAPFLLGFEQAGGFTCFPCTQLRFCPARGRRFCLPILRGNCLARFQVPAQPTPAKPCPVLATLPYLVCRSNGVGVWQFYCRAWCFMDMASEEISSP